MTDREHRGCGAGSSAATGGDRHDASSAGAMQSAERRRLRAFGLMVGLAFLVLGAFLLWRHRPVWPALAAAGVALTLLGFAAPAWLRPIERIWMRLAGYLGWFMTRLILGVVFLLVFSPAGLIMRLLGADPLKLRFDRRAASYWEPRAAEDRSPERMERMF